jgi:REP element-mobilizing transposase RayT
MRKGLAPGEWLHCYNRGVDKRRVFNTQADYERFLLLTYLSKYENPAHVANFRDKSLHEILLDKDLNLGPQIVEIGAYSLMPNHLHFLLKETKGGGIARFMQKVFTGYTMYFNLKNDRMGALFAGTYKSRHVSVDRYLKHLVSYIHLNPVELIEPGWKEGKGKVLSIRKFLIRFNYSSLSEFEKISRPENILVDKSIFELFDKVPTTKEMLNDAQAYYQGL